MDVCDDELHLKAVLFWDSWRRQALQRDHTHMNGSKALLSRLFKARSMHTPSAATCCALCCLSYLGMPVWSNTMSPRVPAQTSHWLDVWLPEAA